MELRATTEQPVLLHGDFPDKNLLRSGFGYVAIDPNPAIGDRCANASFFAACHPPAVTILQRAQAMAQCMTLDRRVQRPIRLPARPVALNRGRSRHAGSPQRRTRADSYQPVGNLAG
jgi:streptomycin 6-kinase